tara:strand:- start:237 stop:416 length:180 start_codon:yes stop_codon:yes gene_type:complete
MMQYYHTKFFIEEVIKEFTKNVQGQVNLSSPTAQKELALFISTRIEESKNDLPSTPHKL